MDNELTQIKELLSIYKQTLETGKIHDLVLILKRDMGHHVVNGGVQSNI